MIDIDLKAYFDTVRHGILLTKVAQRIDDPKIMRLLKLMLKANGKRGVPQGSLISPLLSNVYLNEVDRMLEKAKEVTRTGKYIHLEYAIFSCGYVEPVLWLRERLGRKEGSTSSNEGPRLSRLRLGQVEQELAVQ